MVDIFPDIVQVVVLSASPDALLGVGCSDILGHVTVRIHYLQENGLKLREKKNTHRFNVTEQNSNLLI